MRVLIIDDDANRANDWARQLGALEIGLSTDEIRVPGKEDVQAMFAELHQRRTAVHNDSKRSNSECVLDNIDVLIVDHDLQEFLRQGQWSTGVEVATMARAFSDVKTIVLVNQYGRDSFDLTLVRSRNSPADFDVGDAQLLYPSLWLDDKPIGFAPWYWGDGIFASTERFSRAVEWISGVLDRPVLTALDLSLGAGVAGFDGSIPPILAQPLIETGEVTFRQMVVASDFLTAKDRLGISAQDGTCARIAAMLLMHHFHRWIIPANDTLIDTPHLVNLYPWLVKNPENVNNWNGCATRKALDYLPAGIEKHRYPHRFLTARPVFWNYRISADGDLQQPSGFLFNSFEDRVFCEDTSTFELFERARPFTSSIQVGDALRFVTTQELFEASFTTADGATVAYEPSVLFSV